MQCYEGGAIMSFNELVKVLASKQDLKAFAFKTKAMLLRMEREVQSARKQESLYWHIASHGVPQSLHCLCLKLAEEYAVMPLHDLVYLFLNMSLASLTPLFTTLFS
ncbi:hypothetical protein JHK87_005537 [Glycine soja]|nr:hypothetical protein JHK87_005537 [Glycine soja]